MKSLRAMHYVMGTLLDCTLFDLPEACGRELLHAGMSEVRRLERLLNVHDPDSALSQLNRQAGRGPVQVEAELWHLLAQCAALTQLTDGAFDVSAGSEAFADLPSPAWQLGTNGIVEVAPGAQLDLGGIGKGYAVDRLVALWRTARVPRALINFGESSLYALGEAPEAQAWPILVRGLDAEEVLGVLWMQDCALSTSHSFGRCSPAGASHIWDPLTGLPVAQPCLSTIVAPRASLAEALSTATLVRGTTWGDMLERFPEVEGLYMGRDRILHCTVGLCQRFQPYAEVL